MSRADLARGTGLSRTTVSSLVTELIGIGRITEIADRGRPHKGGSGRPPVLVALSAPAGGVAGVDIGHGHVRVAVADRTGQVLAEELALVDVDSHGAEALDRAARMVRAAAPAAGLPLSDLHAVGMCVPAPLDRRSAKDQHRDPAGLAGPAARRGARAPPRPARAHRQRRQPRRPRRAQPRSGAGRQRHALRQGRRRPGCRHRARRAAAPRHQRHRRRDRPRAGGRGRPGVPVRQPRLPRDRRLGAPPDRAAAAGVRRRALHRARPRARCRWAIPPYAGC